MGTANVGAAATPFTFAGTNITLKEDPQEHISEAFGVSADRGNELVNLFQQEDLSNAQTQTDVIRKFAQHAKNEGETLYAVYCAAEFQASQVSSAMSALMGGLGASGDDDDDQL